MLYSCDWGSKTESKYNISFFYFFHGQQYWWYKWYKWYTMSYRLILSVWIDQIREEKNEKNWLSVLKYSPSEWDHNTTPLLKIHFQEIKRKAAWMNFSKQLQLLLEEQKEICWINGEGLQGEGMGFVEITDSIFRVSKIGFGFPRTIWVVIASPMNEVFKFCIF